MVQMNMNRFKDDLMDKLSRRFMLGNVNKKLKKKKMKRVGMTELNRLDKRMNNYVRNVKVVEKGKLWDDSTLLKFLKLFPRLKRLDISGVGDLKNEMFKEIKTEELISLDITGCKDLTKELFGKEFKLCSSLTELKMGTIIKKIDEAVELPKLERLVIQPPIEGCVSYTKPLVNVMLFPTYFKAPNLKTVEFINVDFVGVVNDENFEESRKKKEFFLEGYKKLNSLRLEGISELEEHHFDHLFQLEELSVQAYHSKDKNQAVNDQAFRFLTNLKSLVLKSGYKFTSGIFQYLPKLEVLDIQNCSSLYLHHYDLKTHRFSEVDLQNFKKLKEFHFCCKYPISFEDFESGKISVCGCAEFILKNNLQDDQEEKDTKNILHPGCSKCMTCEICKQKVDCRKIQTYSCDNCSVQMCGKCTSTCERCNRSLCPCVSVKLFMAFCECGYESLCQDCLNEFEDCSTCNRVVCVNCSSRCKKCLERKCNEQCLRSYKLDEDDNCEDITKDERVCKVCKEN